MGVRIISNRLIYKRFEISISRNAQPRIGSRIGIRDIGIRGVGSRITELSVLVSANNNESALQFETVLDPDYESEKTK